MSYKLPKVKGLDMTLNGHIFNVLDEVFVQDELIIVDTIVGVQKNT